MKNFTLINRFVVAPSSGQHWDLLDGLRGLAILMVVACHGVFANPQGAGWMTWVAYLASGGHLGVQVFFVLSGFLIAYPFCRARAGDTVAWYVPGYVTRRLLKIVPPFYLTIVLLCAGYFWRYRDMDYVTTGAKWAVGIPHLFYVAHAFNWSFWSLWAEIGFYVLLPLAFLLTRGRGMWFCAGAFALLLFCVPPVTRALSWPVPGQPGHYMLYIAGRFPNALTNFSWGVLFAAIYAANRQDLARWRRWARLGYAGAALLPATLLLYMVLAHRAGDLGLGWVQTEWMLFLSGVSTFLMFFFMFDPGCAGNRVLSMPALRYIGLISYEWFLLHQPALWEYRRCMVSAGGSLARYCLIVFAPMAASLLAASAMYHFFSAPIIRWGRRRLDASRQHAQPASAASLSVGRQQP